MSRGLRALVACVAILAPVGTAQARTAAQANPQKDFRIAHDVVAAVNNYTQFTVFDDVSVGVEDGVVTLNGKVTMPYKRNELEKRAAAVDGVREISNRISVLPVSMFDDELRNRIARSINGNSNFRDYAIMRNPPIHIVVDRGHVTLTGVVRSNVDRMLARSLATQFSAFSVTSKLKTDAEMNSARESSD
jgi:osmotically-inducible protein OsmY